MLITTCITVFHVSFFILVIFSFFHFFILSFSKERKTRSFDSLSIIRTCGVRSTRVAATLCRTAGCDGLNVRLLEGDVLQ